MYDIRSPIPAKPVRFMDRLKFEIRRRNLAFRTEKTYCSWAKSFIKFHRLTDDKSFTIKQIEDYLSYLSVTQKCAINTQKTALNALIFTYRHVLNIEVPDIHFARAKRSRRIPVVLNHREATSIIDQLSGVNKLASSLMYGSGLRVMEAVRLRVQDIQFEENCIIVRESKGQKWNHQTMDTHSIR